MLVIGFGTEVIERTVVSYYLLQNSHGPGWGNNGYARFATNIRTPIGYLISGGIVPTMIAIPKPVLGPTMFPTRVFLTYRFGNNFNEVLCSAWKDD
ncbi:cathepsin b [Trifolium pratense]|uniref:Cathepsin b n=1 Tax=Trifolium pratense TaxID=57577 RepID=A0A2K3JLJ7_TRIPR|nr:cathepsin b [Trifolium pratense]